MIVDLWYNLIERGVLNFMLGKYIWFIHLYSCLGVSDLEILYEKMSRLGLILCKSNSWADCYKVEKPTNLSYKVVPRISKAKFDIDYDKWRLIAKNNKCYIFLPNKQEDEFKELDIDMIYDNNPVSKVVFLFAFPICFYYFFERFNVIENGMNPSWLNLMFVGVAAIIYIGYVGAFFGELAQRKKYVKNINSVRHKHNHFWFCFVISCIINILQVVLLAIVIYEM